MSPWWCLAVVMVQEMMGPAGDCLGGVSASVVGFFDGVLACLGLKFVLYSGPQRWGMMSPSLHARLRLVFYGSVPAVSWASSAWLADWTLACNIGLAPSDQISSPEDSTSKPQISICLKKSRSNLLSSLLLGLPLFPLFLLAGTFPLGLDCI